MENIVAIIENGIVANVIVADEWPGGVRIEHLDPRPGIGWAYDGEAFTSPSPGLEPELPPMPRRITRLALLQRITMPEHVAIELASIHNPAAPTVQHVQAATLRKMLQLVNAANWIDLDRPDTRAMITQIEQMGLLAPGRALEILDGVITDIERPQADTPLAVGA